MKQKKVFISQDNVRAMLAPLGMCVAFGEDIAVWFACDDKDADSTYHTAGKSQEDRLDAIMTARAMHQERTAQRDKVNALLTEAYAPRESAPFGMFRCVNLD